MSIVYINQADFDDIVFCLDEGKGVVISGTAGGSIEISKKAAAMLKIEPAEDTEWNEEEEEDFG